MRRGPHRWSRFVLIAILALGHSAGIQVLAWTTMLMARLPTESITKAVESTFDGSSPCALCHLSSALDQAERAPAVPGKDGIPQAPAKVVKPDFMLSSVTILAEMAMEGLAISQPRIIDDVELKCIQPAPEPPPPQV